MLSQFNDCCRLCGRSNVVVPMWWLQHEAKILIGASEATIQQRLGTPYKIITATQITALPKGSKWWGESWSPAPLHRVSNKVLLYYEGAAGVIIFIDPQGVVEHVTNTGT